MKFICLLRPARAQRMAFQCHPLRGAYAALARTLRAKFEMISPESASTLTSMIGELIQKRDLNKKHEI